MNPPYSPRLPRPSAATTAVSAYRGSARRRTWKVSMRATRASTGVLEAVVGHNRVELEEVAGHLLPGRASSQDHSWWIAIKRA
jgi:hypothetical protein